MITDAVRVMPYASRSPSSRSALPPKAPQMAECLVEDSFTALCKQTVGFPGIGAAAVIVSSLVGSLTTILDQHNMLAGRV
ncbi:hypothetical protein [Streptomyces sp. NPDC001020]